MSDIDFITENMNNLEIRRTMGSVMPVSKQMEEEWIKNAWKGYQEGNHVVFAVTTLDDNLIGTISFFAINKTHQHAELGIAIYPKENQNKGYGTDAIITMCGFGFLHFNLNSIWLKFFEFNKNGHRAYEKAGFSNLSREREVIFREGRFRDILRMDILKSEWEDKFGDQYTLRNSKS